MRASVSVPVLSVQKTSMLPRLWIEASRLTITLLAAIRSAPRDSVTETTMEEFGGQSHRKGHGKQERFEPGAVKESVDQKDEQDKEHR